MRTARSASTRRGPKPGTSANLIIGNTNCPWCPGNGPDWGPATAGIDLQTAFYPESGIPTFREAQTGLWAQYRPEELATPEAFAREPELVWRFYRWRRQLVGLQPAATSDAAPAFLDLGQLAGGGGNASGDTGGSGWELELTLGESVVVRLRGR